ncbi:MAG TPA: TonB family protein [Candidatus Sulfotelmatobacter sp.]|nr:TonB family protein [Candidatus Sulfotelmatobacter sp.]
MGDLPLPATSGPGVFSRTVQTVAFREFESDPPPNPDGSSLLSILRQSLAAGAQSTDSILNAVAGTARIISGADGTALAVRTNGVVLCRARNGDIAPEFGAPVNVDSGISGECLRTAMTLVCHDSEVDDRVDPEVCRRLGIRSIVVVPLRGSTGMIGILEAFSARPDAFDGEQISSLRTLAEIAEAACERDRDAPPLALAAPPTIIPPVSIAPPKSASKLSKFEFERVRRLLADKRYWIPAVAAVVLLMVGLVVRLSWKQTGDEIAASAASQPHAVAENTTAPSSTQIAPLKPNAAIVVHQSTSSTAKKVLQNAADLQPDTDTGDAPIALKGPVATDTSAKAAHQQSSAEAVDVPPPSIEVAESSAPNDLLRAVSGPTEMPAFGAKVSQGIVEASLIRKVEPTYPADARLRRLSGPVTLDATIGDDGSVKTVSVVSGAAVLASAAKSAVREWRFSPAKLDGKPIESQKRITLVFRLPQ